MSIQPLEVVSSSATDFLTTDQVKEFIENVPSLEIYQKNIYCRKPLPEESFQMYVKTIYDAALRAGEGRLIKVEDLDLKYARINLPKTKTGWDWCKCAKHEKRRLISSDLECKKCKGTGKLLRPQRATISDNLARELHEFVQDNDFNKSQYLFHSPSFPKQEISRDWIWKSIKSVGKLCNFEIFGERKHRTYKTFYTHLFRRSRAIQMDLDKAPIGVIARKLRHMDIRTTTTYIKSSIVDLQTWERDNGTWF